MIISKDIRNFPTAKEQTDSIGAELFARYSTMSQREIAERAIFLEGYIVSLTGKIAPDYEVEA